MPRFLHTADWQIGRQFESFGPEDGPALAEARLNTVARIAQLATERQVDAVLVAGDVFDAQTVSDRTLRRLFLALEAYAGPWVMIPGNHDAALAESVWSRAQRLGAVPHNVHLLLTPEPLLLEAGIAVLPAPLTQRHTYTDLTAWFDSAETPPDAIRVGLAHGAVQGILAEEIDSANPIAPDRAERARLDYLALGDWHGCKQIEPRIWYSGTPEPERFRNNDAGEVLEVEIVAPSAVPQVTRHATACHRWHSIEARLAVESDLTQLIGQLEQLEAGAVIDLELEGQIDLAGNERLRDALSRAEALHRALRTDLSGLRLIPTEADIARLHADGYLGEVIAELRDSQQQAGDELSREALVILADLLRGQSQDQSPDQPHGQQESGGEA